MDAKLQFLERKWRMWFRNLDLDSSGAISRRTAELCTKYFIDANDFNPKRVDEMTEILSTFWNVYIIKYHEIGPDDGINQQQFVDRLRKHYQTNFEEFRSFFKRGFILSYIATDINTDGYIDYEELRGVWKSFNHVDDAITKKFFDSYKVDANGAIPISQVIDSWVDFVSGDDPEKFNSIVDLIMSDDRTKNA